MDIYYSIGSCYSNEVKVKYAENLEQLIDQEALDNYIRTDNKKSVAQIFPCEFIDGQKNIDKINEFGLVILDFDNESDEIITPEIFENILKKHFGNVSAFIAHTHSSTKEKPKFRVFIELHEEVEPEIYTEIQKAFYVICDAKGIDKSSVTNLALGYLVPSLPKNSEIDGFYYANLNDDYQFETLKLIEMKGEIGNAKVVDTRNYLLIKQLAREYDKKFADKRKFIKPANFDAQRSASAGESELIGLDMHRRDRLNKIIYAEFMAGNVDDDVIAQKIATYDLTYHDDQFGGPYFEDYHKRPKFFGQSVGDLALEYVQSELKHLERKHRIQKQTRKNSIFGW